MGTTFDAHCEEYLFFNEYMQGNIFAGLMYDDLVEEEMAFDDSCYVVYVEELSDSFILESSLAPSHEPYCRLEDGLYFTAQFGPTVRAYQSALTVLHTCKVVPIDFCFMSVEVLHGVETFYEELWSEIHAVCASAPANYIFDTVYESFNVVFEPDWYIPESTVRLNLGVNDLVNMRHVATQDYYFNCIALDDVGFTLLSKFGYHMRAHSQWRMDSSAYNAIGKMADDYLMVDDDKAEINWNGMCFASDIVMAFEWLTSHRGYDFTLESTIDGADSVDTYYYMVHLVEEAFSLSALSLSPTERHQFVADVLRTASKVACDAHYRESVGSEIVIDEDSGVAHIMYYSVSDDMIVSGEV